jgi:hypothetical protein
MRFQPALPPRSMVGQLPLEQLIGVRIPGGQPSQALPRPTSFSGSPLNARTSLYVAHASVRSRASIAWIRAHVDHREHRVSPKSHNQAIARTSWTADSALVQARNAGHHALRILTRYLRTTRSNKLVRHAQRSTEAKTLQLSCLHLESVRHPE